jgi:NAD(P)-dependent dehydrogenase (short-subunit alcohol dehydrogenase family)
MATDASAIDFDPPVSGHLATDLVALVTGAGSGIGRAAALRLGGEGAAAVVVADRDGGAANATAAALRAAGTDAHAITCDVTVESEVEALVRDTVQRYGRLDAAVNNAGISDTARRFHEMPLDEWDRVVAVDLTSVFLCMKHELAHMVQVGRGAIVNTASGAGIIGFPGLPHYVASKHGVLGLTKTAALEYARDGIRVNAVCPGVTDTPMVRASIGRSESAEARLRATVPTGQLGRPHDVAAAIVWLCSSQAGWVTGESMLVDGASVCR